MNIEDLILEQINKRDTFIEYSHYPDFTEDQIDKAIDLLIDNQLISRIGNKYKREENNMEEFMLDMLHVREFEDEENLKLFVFDKDEFNEEEELIAFQMYQLNESSCCLGS